MLSGPAVGDSWQHGWGRLGLQPVSLATYPMSSGACSCSRLLDMTPAGCNEKGARRSTYGWSSGTDRGVHLLRTLCATRIKAIKLTPLCACPHLQPTITRLRTHQTSEIVSRPHKCYINMLNQLKQTFVGV